MPKTPDPDTIGGVETSEKQWLREQQYGDSRNLEARRSLHDRFSTADVPWFRWIFNQLDLPENAFIVELGCGSGALWSENLDRIPRGWRALCSDFSNGMALDARARIGGHNPPIQFAVIDAEYAALSSGFADAVIANHVLYHTEDFERALTEITRIIAPTGILYASTVGQSHLAEISALVDQIDEALGFPAAAPDNTAADDSPFLVENGDELLRRYFADVRLTMYHDVLHITDRDALIDFVFSSTDYEPEEKETAARIVDDLFPSSGVFRVHKSLGLFEARAPLRRHDNGRGKKKGGLVTETASHQYSAT